MNYIIYIYNRHSRSRSTNSTNSSSRSTWPQATILSIAEYSAEVCIWIIECKSNRFLFSPTPFKWLILQSSIHTLKYLQESKVSTVTRAITNNKSGESSWVSKTLASRN